MPEKEFERPLNQPDKFSGLISKITQPDITLPIIDCLWMAAALRLMLSYEASFTDKLIQWSVIAGVTFIVGSLCDSISTIRTLRSLDRADELGIQHGIIEGNTMLPDRPTEEELLFDRKHLIFKLKCEALGILIPPIGIGLGIGGLAAAANNELVRLSVVRKINQVKGESKAD